MSDVFVTDADVLACGVHLSEDGQRVVILDQSQLPNREVWPELDSLEAMVAALKKLQVRGAPAIGIFAGYGVYVRALAAAKVVQDEASAFRAQVEADGEALIAARPTAVNLSWAVKRMLARLDQTLAGGASVNEAVETLRQEALAIHKEDIAMCTRIARFGLTLLRDGDGILTHCNAGPLATSKYGTALGPILLGHEQGLDLHVFADETRPLLQGARLTAWELDRAGVDVTLICDNMAASVMAAGKVQAVFVGCDRIAANGDFANKIGTLGVAVLAKHFGIPFYTLGPSSTVDLTCETGADIRIEERPADEIRSAWYAEPQAPAGVRCFNPAFDVTPAELITGIVTDRGIIYPPFEENLRAALTSPQ